MRRRIIPGLALAACLLSFLPLGAAAPARVVAIGDVHGAFDAFAATLRRAGLIDEKQRWAGGSAVFVQTGDVMDRGTGVRAAFDLLMALERQADSARGRVQVVLGNHEVMNFFGITRDASPEVYATFADGQSESRRTRALEAVTKQRKDLDSTAWMAAHPPGFVEYRAAFSPDGRYGKWLRSKPIAVKIGDSIFMHGGVNPSFTTGTLEEMVDRAKREIAEWDEGVRWLQEQKFAFPFSTFEEISEAAQGELTRLAAARQERELTDDELAEARRLLPLVNVAESSVLNENGPLWFRGYARWSDAEGAPQISALLAKFGVKRFVTGHTPQASGRITRRFDGAVFLIDTGMLGGQFFPSGRGSALEISGTTLKAIYDDGTVPFEVTARR